MMVILLLLTSHSGAAAAHGTNSSMEGNGTTTIDIILVSDQYAELELQHMMESETGRILQGYNPVTPKTSDSKMRFSCPKPYPVCIGLQTNSHNGEHCDIHKRNCHQAMQ
ncbi:hypothetical protein FNV43_RR14583 [Rhamnella rubrinervis]|uniref:Uncharacterized protein n=1 Tax=Rhamnella rubrinervis TaxID=2594499 RepID=A0A8K0MGH6_9ROSA|nr:hypothetical protein FNV43_RR14583 [Rhamnella rubrinervis]